LWCWDHFIGQGSDRSVPVVESWTTLAMAAAQTTRVTVGPS
jgi:alkanesulfonate monooxygenase SsuD/methylene tetrahydromethanopterin reductase-like flavin-dependent oxidoreductase (luciferase family)